MAGIKLEAAIVCAIGEIMGCYIKHYCKLLLTPKQWKATSVRYYRQYLGGGAVGTITRAAGNEMERRENSRG